MIMNRYYHSFIVQTMYQCNKIMRRLILCLMSYVYINRQVITSKAQRKKNINEKIYNKKNEN